MVMARGVVETYLARQLNSYTWIKKLSLDEIMSELNKLKVKPKFKTEPWKHQAACFMIALCEPRFLQVLDMGAGKSKLLLDTATQLQRESKFRKGLITVPRLVNFASWEDACLKHSDLEPTICSGSIDEKWEHLLTNKTDLAIIDYAGLHLALSKKGKDKKGKTKLVKDPRKVSKLKQLYNFVALDESHKLKNSASLRFKILDPLTKEFDFVYCTTGTLFGKNTEDLWAQFYITDRGETFGSSLGLFRAAFYKESQDFWKGRVYEFDKSKTRLLHRFLQNKSIRYDQDELEGLPKCSEQVLKLPFGEEQRNHYLLALQGLIDAKGKIRDLDGAWIKMRQILSGYLSWKDEYGPHLIIFKDNPKLEMLLELIEDCGDQKIVISTEYTQSGQIIADALTKLKIGFEWLYGKTKDPQACVRSFISNPDKQVFLMNSEAGGTGVDGLQAVSRYLVFYESPVSLITRKQTLKRVYRSGQLKRSYIYDLCIANSSDLSILSSISAGTDMYSNIVNGTCDLHGLLRLAK